MQRVTGSERRARLVRRHLLDSLDRVSSVAEVAHALVAIHSTDPASVFMSVHVRTEARSGCDRAGAVRRTQVVRMLGMRRTLFVVERDLQPVVQSACTDEIAARERSRLEGWIEETPGIEGARAWLDRAEKSALEAVTSSGEVSTAEVVRSVPLLATKLHLGSGRWALEASAGSRVLPLLAAQGLLLRARPRGTCISGQYRWTSTRSWLGHDLERPPEDDARAELVRRWLAAYGPGTELDVRWWTGLGARPVRTALATVGAVEVDLEGATGYVLPDDLDAVEPPEPSAALLPTLDSTTMGWKERDWYLGPHAAVVFDSNGNAGPTVWWDGRVVGGWSQRASGELAYRVLEDVGADAEAAIEAVAAHLRGWLGDVRFKPGFLPPFRRELAA